MSLFCRDNLTDRGPRARGVSGVVSLQCVREMPHHLRRLDRPHRNGHHGLTTAKGLHRALWKSVKFYYRKGL
jgi:hypothetical protein